MSLKVKNIKGLGKEIKKSIQERNILNSIAYNFIQEYQYYSNCNIPEAKLQSKRILVERFNKYMKLRDKFDNYQDNKTVNNENKIKEIFFKELVNTEKEKK